MIEVTIKTIKGNQFLIPIESSNTVSLSDNLNGSDFKSKGKNQQSAGMRSGVIKANSQRVKCRRRKVP